MTQSPSSLSLPPPSARPSSPPPLDPDKKSLSITRRTSAVGERTDSECNSNSSSSSSRDRRFASPTTLAAPLAPTFPFIPRQNQRLKATLPFPRLYSGPLLFASPSVAVHSTHVVTNNTVGPLTPPLATSDAPLLTCPSSSMSMLPTPAPTPTTTSQNSSNEKSTRLAYGLSASHQDIIRKQQQRSLQHHRQTLSRRRSSGALDVVHDLYCCMFRITLDSKGTIAALCYLPTRFKGVVEFYHTEIPTAYRDLGLGDLLVIQGLRWAETAKLLVIPTCPFVQRYLEQNSKWNCVVGNENEAYLRLTSQSPEITDNDPSVLAVE